MSISSDRPIAQPKDDRFGLSRTFIPRLARVCIDWPADDGLVVGLFGPWGIGKSSVLNLLRHHLDRPIGGTNVVCVATFSPWLYENAGSLITSFFATVAASLPEAPRGSGPETAKNCLRAMGQFLTIASRGFSIAGVAVDLEQLTKALKEMGEVSESLGKATEAAGQLVGMIDEGERKLEKSRELLRSALLEMEGRVLVVIDDVDRLNKVELLELLRLVRIVADLPRVTILISMDDARVRDVLSDAVSEGYGQAYLDKIVQVPIHVPPVSQTAMAEALASEIENVLAGQGRRPSDDLRPSSWSWSNHTFDLVLPLLSTPRDLARLGNSLRVLLLSGDDSDLHDSDAVMLEALHVFRPDVYDRVRHGKHKLLKDPLSGLKHVASPQQEKARAAEKEEADYQWIVDGGEPEPRRDVPAKAILDRLFGRTTLDRYDEEQDAAQRRLRSPRSFDSYFQYAAPIGLVTREEVAGYVSALRDGANSRDLTRLGETLLGMVQGRDMESIRDLLRDVQVELRPWRRHQVQAVADGLAGILAVLESAESATALIHTLLGALHTWRPEQDTPPEARRDVESTTQGVLEAAIATLPTSRTEALAGAAERAQWIDAVAVRTLDHLWLARALEVLEGDLFDAQDYDRTLDVLHGIHNRIDRLGAESPLTQEQLTARLTEYVRREPTALFGLLFWMSVIPGGGKPRLFSSKRDERELPGLLLARVSDLDLVRRVADAAGRDYEVPEGAELLLSDLRVLLDRWDELTRVAATQSSREASDEDPPNSPAQ